LCNFASWAARSFTAYGFLLAGYTVAILGVPAALNPSGAYPLVVARFTEIVLGIACAALVSRVMLAPKLIALVRGLARWANVSQQRRSALRLIVSVSPLNARNSSRTS
jgi:uncharacterized membrane protein YccC